MSKTVATVRARGMMYKAVLKLVLIKDSDSLVVTGSMLKVLEVLHHQVSRIITGMTVRRTKIREW